jgi:hypothetical protein
MKSLNTFKMIGQINISDYFSPKYKIMKFQLFIIIIVLFAISCGTERHLIRSYKGEPVSELGEDFGAPKSVIEKDGEKIYVFEKKEELKRTEINQGKLTLDPMVTPKVLKTEIYYFTVKDGIVTKVRLEEEYER